MPEEYLYQASTTPAELMSIALSIVVERAEQEPTIIDEASLLMVVNNDWTMVVDCEQPWTMVVDNIDELVHFRACSLPMDVQQFRILLMNMILRIWSYEHTNLRCISFEYYYYYYYCWFHHCTITFDICVFWPFMKKQEMKRNNNCSLIF